jgi:hypothetical protein
MVLRMYNSAGFHIKTIHCNGEFRAMMEMVKDGLGVRMNFTNALDHVPEAERNNRTIKEWVQAYKALPRTLIRYLVTTQASQLNLFPAKGGISPYYSPRTILGLPVLDYDKHCTVPFGAYVQANHETNQTNSNAARTIDTIYLCPAINMQGGHELYDFNSNRVITGVRVTQIPVLTDVVIKAIERIAKDQGFKTLKFKNRKGAIFHNADWIAGVDYDDNIPQDTEDKEAYDDNENEDPEDDENIDSEYDQINEDELKDLIEDEREQTNPNQHLEDEEQGAAKAEGEEEEPEDDRTAVISKQETELQGSELRRSARESQPVSRLKPNMSGKSYLQKDDKTKKKVMFAEDELKQLEYCHNLVSQVKPEKEQIIEYGLSQAMLIARFIQDITMNVQQHGASFAQQYILQKGQKVLENKDTKHRRKK